MGTLDIQVSLEVECECGAKLDAAVERYHGGRTGERVVVQPCETCGSDQYQEGYDEGYGDGQSEAEAG